MLMIADKESFLVRVLTKKVRDAGIDCAYVPWNINEISAQWEGTGLLAVYMDEGERPREDILHYLVDKLSEDGTQMIPIGSANDVRFFCDRVPGDVIYRTFVRPVDNEAFIATVSELFMKLETGEFRKSILVVDDDPNYLGLVREWLKGTYKVAMVSSGLQAIKWLGRNKADLILLDYEMPVTNGPQVLEMLRNDTETRSIPVMFLTGKGDKKSVMEVLALKPEGYLLKTIKREELLENLKGFFAAHRK